jgi:hypothetical protein
MDYLIKGKIHDDQNNPIPDILVKAFDSDPLFRDDFLGETKSEPNGKFEISFKTRQFDWSHTEAEPEVYVIISDAPSLFESVVDRQGAYSKKDDNVGNTTWVSNVIDNISNLDKYDITIRLVPVSIPKEVDTVVVGSGFGGTILSLS